MINAEFGWLHVKIENNMGKLKTTEDWIKDAKKIHGDKYDYSKAKYVDAKTKICIICPIHGEFWQEASSHLMGRGCPNCGKEIRVNKQVSTSEKFIKSAKEVHGDKYDYSKVKYTKAREKVCIICPIHGEFWQTPDAHLRQKQGCPKCSGKKVSTEEFIKKAKKIHNNRYNYSKVEYINAKAKVCITCPIHGEFWQLPEVHLRGGGCPKCSGKNITTEEFINRAREVHGDKYDYSKVKYGDSKTKVCIICPKHGEFWQLPGNHLRGKGCILCSKPVYNTNSFIEEAKKVHGDKYDYSKAKYTKAIEKVCIICPIHGEFWQTPNSHLRGQGCPKCGGSKQLTTKEFIGKAREIHGDKYDYSKVEYVNANTKVCIICPIHGEFWQTPTSHLNSSGCPVCGKGFTKEYKFNLLKEFESEYEFRAFLANNDINILKVILRNIEPKFDPIKQDVEKSLAHITEIDPIKTLRDKYTSDSEDELDEEFFMKTVPNIDLDNDNAIDIMASVDVSKNNNIPTIDEVIKNTKKEIKVINKVEHLLTPEDREYIMCKFLNDKRRMWMYARENSVK